MSNDNKILQEKQTVSGNIVLEVSYEKHPEHGLKIKCKSPINWKFLRHKNGGLMNFMGIKCYRPFSPQIQGLDAFFMEDNVIEFNGLPNLMILLAQDINQGVEFNCGVMAISEEKIEKMAYDLKDQVKKLYLQYCKPFNCKVKITSEVVEKPEYD